MSKGKLLVFEGVDASGKKSQTLKVVEYLKSKNIKVKTYSFPQYETLIGNVIANYLTGHYGDINSIPNEFLCIAYAADRLSIQNELNEFIDKGYYVVIDRYVYSNLFNVAKSPENKWKNLINWIEDLEFNNLNIKKPDYNFYLYVDPNISIQRIKERGKREYQNDKDDIYENNEKLLNDVSKCYLEFAKNKKDWIVIDQMDNNSQMSPDKVFEKIKFHIDKIIDS